MPFLFLLFIVWTVSFSSSVLAQDSSVEIRGPRGTERTVQPPQQQQQFGPLTPNDTLWGIAQRVRPDSSVSVYQVMYALYQKNPDAFLEDNLNHLRPGAMLFLPDLAEIRAVNLATARQKSDSDDKIWAERNKTAAVAANTATAVKQDAVSASRLQEELTRQEQQQRQELEELRKQFRESLLQVDAVAMENHQLRTTLAKLQQELEQLKSRLADDSELQAQIDQLLKQQAELQSLQQTTQDIPPPAAVESSGWQSVTANPLTWILAASVPALLVLLGILMWVKRRSQQVESAVNAAKADAAPVPGYQSPLPPLDEQHDIDGLHDADDSSLFELDESLLEDAFHETTDFNQDDSTPELYSQPADPLYDDNVLDDGLLPADDLTAIEPEIATGLADDKELDPDNILSASDLDELLNATDDDELPAQVVELSDDAEPDELTDTAEEDFLEEIELDIPEEQEPESFDTSELDEFAESLVDAEPEDDLLLSVDYEDSEASLSAELADILEQAENTNRIATAGDELSGETMPGTGQGNETMPDLSSGEDSSVAPLSEAALSVENPSKVLDSYPELELADDDSLTGTLPDERSTDMALLADDELNNLEHTQFDELLSELEAMADTLPEESDIEEPQIFADTHTDIELDDDDFVEIDKLLEASDAFDDEDKFTNLNVDVGLDEFSDIIDAERLDVDTEDQGYAAKLDLVRAYIEIDDRESADLLLDEILGSEAPENVKEEARQLQQ